MLQRQVGYSGFTLVEAVVAMTLLSFGLIAAASGMGAVARMLYEGRVMTESATIAARRMALVRAEGCGAAGQEVQGSFAVAWGGSAVPHGRVVSVTVRRLGPRPGRPDTVDSFQKCPP